MPVINIRENEEVSFTAFDATENVVPEQTEEETENLVELL